MAISSSFLPSSFSFPLRPAFTSEARRGCSMVVRMGGGPRTFPGGVSKWQWKRMQEKKAKQLLKARLMRERQIYEMRKRAEMKEAVGQLERPWEAVAKAPTLFSLSVDEQVKTLADRFQKPGGFDMWNERDGPQVFKTPNDLPSVRFFPKGSVHSIKPYTKEGEEILRSESSKDELRFDDWVARGAGGIRRTRSRKKNEDSKVEIEVEIGAEKGVDLSGNSNNNMGAMYNFPVQNDENVEKFEQVKDEKRGGLGRNALNKKNYMIAMNRRNNNMIGDSVNLNKKKIEAKNGWERRKYGIKDANSNEANFGSDRRFNSNNGRNEGSFESSRRFASNNIERNEGNFRRNRRFVSNDGENDGSFQRHKRFGSNNNNGENEGNFERNGKFSSNNHGESERNFQKNRRFSSNNGENKGNFGRNGRFSTNNDGGNEHNFQRNGISSENEGNFQRNRRFSSNNSNLRLRPTSNLHYAENEY